MLFSVTITYSCRQVNLLSFFKEERDARDALVVVLLHLGNPLFPPHSQIHIVGVVLLLFVFKHAKCGGALLDVSYISALQ